MKKLMSIMICILLVGIGLLSGCEGQEKYRTGQSPLQPNFIVSNGGVQDNCESTYPGNGTVWVNFTITNFGGQGGVAGRARVW